LFRGFIGKLKIELGALFYDRQYLTHGLSLKNLVAQKVLGYNKDIPWPCAPTCTTSADVKFDPKDIHNFWRPSAFLGKVTIGLGTWISGGAGIFAKNRNGSDLSQYCEDEPIIIGEYCWIGWNAVILPGVILGDHTIVGANAVVTKSFPEGYCVIAGNPAKLIRGLTDEHIN